MSSNTQGDWVRSTTDPVSNFSFIRSISLTRDLGTILKGVLHGSSLPTFLHEAMHHWCFTSRVGTALSVLQIRARSAAYHLHKISSRRYRAVLKIKRPNQKIRELLQPPDERALMRAVAVNLVRYEAASSVLAPLIEGIALLSEFDTFSTASDTITMPMWWAQMFATMDVPPTIRDRAFLVELRSGRMAAEFINKKMDLLSQSVECARSPYLVGYFCVKRLWAECATRDRRFRDPEMFLTYLTFIVFNDLELARILLDPTVPTYQVPTKVLHRLKCRLRNLPEDLKSKWSTLVEERKRHAELLVNRGEALARDEILKEMNAPPEIRHVDDLRFNSREEARRGNAVMKDAIDQLLSVGTVAIDETIARVNALTLSQRELLRIGCSAVDVSCDGNIVSVYKDDTIVAQIAALPGVTTSNRRSGQIELIISLVRYFKALLVFVGEDVAGIVYWGRPDEEPQQLLKLARSQQDLAEDEKSMREWTARVVSDFEIDLLTKRLRRRIGRIADTTYREIALLGPADSLWIRMQTAGLFEFLDYDENLLEAAALISIGCSIRLTSNSIRELVGIRVGEPSNLECELRNRLLPLGFNCDLSDNDAPVCDI